MFLAMISSTVCADAGNINTAAAIKQITNFRAIELLLFRFSNCKIGVDRHPRLSFSSNWGRWEDFPAATIRPRYWSVNGVVRALTMPPLGLSQRSRRLFT